MPAPLERPGLFGKSQKTIRDGIRYGMAKPIYQHTPHQQAMYQPTPTRQNNTWLLDGRVIYGEPLMYKLCDNYPAEWGI